MLIVAVERFWWFCNTMELLLLLLLIIFHFFLFMFVSLIFILIFFFCSVHHHRHQRYCASCLVRLPWLSTIITTCKFRVEKITKKKNKQKIVNFLFKNSTFITIFFFFLLFLNYFLFFCFCIFAGFLFTMTAGMWLW